MNLTVESVDRTKSGNAYMVKANGQRYVSKAPGIEQAVGKVIDAVVGSFKGDKGPVSTIESFTASSAAPAAVSGNHWYMPFISNICAHAIASGLIKDGEGLKTWTRHAQAAALALDEPDF